MTALVLNLEKCQMKWYDIFPIAVIVFSWICIALLSFPESSDDLRVDGTRRMAFATLATPAFAMGAVVLGHTLRKHHGNKYDMVCLVSPDVNETWRSILKQWWTVRPVPEYKPGGAARRSWTKLKLWTLTEYKKVVYFDTDVLVLKPVDKLFEYPELSCASDPDPPQICNTGVFVLEPSLKTYQAMDNMVRVDRVRKGIGDQASINAFFGGFTPIPPAYNLARVAGSGLGDMLKRDEARVIHFVCKKPWKCGREGVKTCGCGYQKLNEVWWATWDEACQDHQCVECWYEAPV